MKISYLQQCCWGASSHFYGCCCFFKIGKGQPDIGHVYIMVMYPWCPYIYIYIYVCISVHTSILHGSISKPALDTARSFSGAKPVSKRCAATAAVKLMSLKGGQHILKLQIYRVSWIAQLAMGQSVQAPLKKSQHHVFFVFFFCCFQNQNVLSHPH